MDDAGGRALLQVCPSDHPPFRDICRSYAVAAALLGWRSVTFFLAAPSGVPLEGASYLNATSLRSTKKLAASLKGAAADALAGACPGAAGSVLALCHRYRAYRVLLASGLDADPVVAVAHEFGFFARRQRRIALGLQRITQHRQPRFAGVSDAVQRELMAVAPDALLLPNGLDLAWADSQRLGRAEARRHLELPEDAFTVAVVGRLHPKKAPRLALEGFRLAVSDMPGARLVFVGSGELGASLQRDARNLPVTFTGFVPDAARYFAGPDLLLLPSSRAEAFGMVVLEAMAAGLPVLSSPAPGPRFVLGEAGDYFEPATPEALAEALRRAHQAWLCGDLAARAGTARQRAEALFSVAAMAARLRHLADPQGISRLEELQ